MVIPVASVSSMITSTRPDTDTAGQGLEEIKGNGVPGGQGILRGHGGGQRMRARGQPVGFIEFGREIVIRARFKETVDDRCQVRHQLRRSASRTGWPSCQGYAPPSPVKVRFTQSPTVEDTVLVPA